MKTGFVAALSIFAILNSGYANAYDLTDWLSTFENNNQQRIKDVDSLMSRLKNIDTEKLNQVQKKQLESVKIFLSSQQDQQNILESLKFINNAQAENIQDLERRYPENYNIKVIVDSFNINQKRISEEIAKFQTTQNLQNDAVKSLITNNVAQNKNIDKSCAEIMKIFLNRSNKQTKWYAMVAAIKRGYTDVVKMFLEIGIDPNATDDNGRTLLMVAAKNSEDIMPLLIKKGAKINVHDKDGYYALDYAYKGMKTENVKYLKKLNAKEKVRRAKSLKRF